MLEQIIEDLLPRALMMGVNYDLFWTLNPKSLSPFIKAFELQQNYDDSIAWQHGRYIQMAIASLLDKSVKYPDKPLSSIEVVEDKVENRKMRKIKQVMMERMIIVNQGLKKGVV